MNSHLRIDFRPPLTDTCGGCDYWASRPSCPKMIDRFIDIARCLLLMVSLEEVEIHGLPGNAECRSSLWRNVKKCAVFDGLAQKVKLPRLRRLEITHSDCRTGYWHGPCGQPDTPSRCCGACRQLESMFDRSLGTFERLRLDLPDYRVKDDRAVESFYALIPQLPSSLQTLYIGVSSAFGFGADFSHQYLQFPPTSRAFKKLHFIPHRGMELLRARRGRWSPHMPSVEFLIRKSSPLKVSGHGSCRPRGAL